MSEEIIESIVEIKIKGSRYENSEGWEITTNKNTYRLLIDSGQSCCEDFGYAISEEDVEDFIHAKLLNHAVVDTAYNTRTEVDVYEGGVIFVNFETDRGTLQFSVYNSHNGYYGHEAKFIVNNKIEVNEVL